MQPNKRLTTEDFIQRAIAVHGEDKYDYKEVEYINSDTRVKIICHEKDKNGHEHGAFWQIAYNHIGHQQQGCPICGRERAKHSNQARKVTTKEFIQRSISVHGEDKFDYSEVEYINNHTKIKIGCKACGNTFFQTPSNHIINKQGCPFCAHSQKLTTELFVQRANTIHGEKYDYREVNCTDARTKVKIICHEKDKNGIEHGEFWQSADSHINKCSDCPICAIEKIKQAKRLPFENFIELCEKIHGKKYDYNEVQYIDRKTKIKILCHEKDENGIEHGAFWQIPAYHLDKCGCPKCGRQRIAIAARANLKHKSFTLSQFIEKARAVHGERYNYDKVEYINSYTKVIITCPVHGDFLQEPGKHINKHQECPKCKTKISRGELSIIKILTEHNINYKPQKTFPDCRGIKKLLPFDFYLIDYDACIEFDGMQHSRTWHGRQDEKYLRKLELTKMNDATKTQYCLNNNIPFLRISYKQEKHIESILLDFLTKLKREELNPSL